MSVAVRVGEYVRLGVTVGDLVLVCNGVYVTVDVGL